MICENCGKEHNGSYGSGRFCCKECARAFSTKNDNSKQLKEVKCIECGTNIYVNKRASIKSYLCDKCKHNKNVIVRQFGNRTKKLLTCKICGRTYIHGTGGCKNIFCKEHRIIGFNLLIKYFSFDKNKLGTLEVENEYNRIRDIIYNLYWKENLAAFQIAQKFNFKSKHCITQTVFKFLNIPTRNFK